MANHQEQSQAEQNWQTRVLVIGAIVGALTGLGTAYLLIQRSETEEGLSLTPGEGVKLGVSVFGFLRQISNLG
jgi:hypothetical protein